MKRLFLLLFTLISASTVVYSGKKNFTLFKRGGTVIPLNKGQSYKLKTNKKSTGKSTLFHIIEIERISELELIYHIAIDTQKDKQAQETPLLLALTEKSLHMSTKGSPKKFDRYETILQTQEYKYFIEELNTGKKDIWDIPICEIINSLKKPRKKGILKSLLDLTSRLKIFSKSTIDINQLSTQSNLPTSLSNRAQSTPYLNKLPSQNDYLKEKSQSTNRLNKQTEPFSGLGWKLRSTTSACKPSHQSDSSEGEQSDSSDSSERIQPKIDPSIAETEFMEIIDFIKEKCMKNTQISG